MESASMDDRDTCRVARSRARTDEDDVTASEVASHAFCAKAWHLEYVLGHRPSAAAFDRRTDGNAAHEAHGRHVATLLRLGPRLVRWSMRLLVLAAALLVVAMVLAQR
jgi:hypothetical protein